MGFHQQQSKRNYFIAKSVEGSMKEKKTFPTYRYLGDRQTDASLKGAVCEAVRREDGKCIRGRNGTMLVSFNGKYYNVLGRRLRKID